ncbi:MAG: hypothetical protein RLZZ338_1988 [Cyanobacteriota bacterium]|jgi:hypothetical protein
MKFRGYNKDYNLIYGQTMGLLAKGLKKPEDYSG